jgi:uncharacterized protein (TIGR02117 family)
VEELLVRALRAAGWAIAIVILAAAAYLGAAAASALFHAEGRRHSGPLTSDLLVCADYAHADYVIPARLASEAWPQLFPWAELQAKHPQLVVFAGWGDVTFFRDVPEWADVRPGMAARALLGLNRTALRFVLANRPADADCLPLAIDERGQQALISHITGGFDLGPDGGFIDAAGPGTYERFVFAEGRYSPFYTCNQWVANGLAAAGLPHAQFAPFAFSVMHPLRP